MKPFDYSTFPEANDGSYINGNSRPEGLGFDWILSEPRSYNANENARWDLLYSRMIQELPGRACDEFLDGISKIGLEKRGVPNLDYINERLSAITGWTLVPVPTPIPDYVRFYHLANKRFPVADFIRSEYQLDNPDQPDIFYDIFAHAPMLANEAYSNFLRYYGKAGYQALRHHGLRSLAAFYMHTVEFGLVNTDRGVRIYGAALLSSPNETRTALKTSAAKRFEMDFDQMLNTEYVHHDVEQSYFVIQSFDELAETMTTFPFEEVYNRIEPSYKLAISAR